MIATECMKRLCLMQPYVNGFEKLTGKFAIQSDLKPTVSTLNRYSLAPLHEEIAGLRHIKELLRRG